MPVTVPPDVGTKLAAKVPPVTLDEIIQCFASRTGKSLLDTRAKNLTSPPTKWFIAETEYGRKLKVCYIVLGNGEVVIKTAYDPNAEEVRIYTKYGEVK